MLTSMNIIKFLKISIIAFLFLIIANVSVALSCDNITTSTCFVDFNKDKKIKILFIGDSFIKGVGDINNTGGYVEKLKRNFKKNFKQVNVVKIARPGRTTKEVLTYIKQNIYKKSGILKKLTGTDVIIFDLGRNDYWNKQGAIYSITTLKRLIKFIKNNSNTKIDPFISASTLIHVNKRYAQENFIKQFNYELLKHTDISGEILQHTFPIDILGEDGLHPTPDGYTYIYEQVREQMVTSLYNVMKYKAKLNK